MKFEEHDEDESGKASPKAPAVPVAPAATAAPAAPAALAALAEAAAVVAAQNRVPSTAMSNQVVVSNGHAGFVEMVAMPCATAGSVATVAMPSNGYSVPAAMEVVSLSLLGPVVQLLEAASLPGGTTKLAADCRRGPFIEGVEVYAKVLDRLGGSMGSYLEANTKKLRNSKATCMDESYRAWLLSEVPMHVAKGYSGYIDDSAFMGNLWIGWLLEFFVEFFALLDQGKETRESAETAYKQTLREHHNWIQSTGFNQAVKRLPARKQLFKELQGEAASIADVERDVGKFVALARPLVALSLKVNDEIGKRIIQEKAALKKP